MLVSNFEIIIYPREHQRTYQETTYELMITNLEDIDIEFLLEIHAGIIGLHYGSVNITDLEVEIINADIVSQPAVQKEAHEFIRSFYFTIPAKVWALVRLSNPIDVQIRGYITLRVPPLRNKSHYLISTQQSSPVKVLLAASRQDFCRSFVMDIVDENGKSAYKTFVNSWLSRQCIELASGKALNEIEPEGIGLATKISDVIDLFQLTSDTENCIIQETTAEKDNPALQ